MNESWKSSANVFQILVVLLKKDLWKVTKLHFPEIKWGTLRLLLDLVVQVTKTCGRTEKRKSYLNTRANQEIGNKLSFISLSLCVWSQMNGRSRTYFVRRDTGGPSLVTGNPGFAIYHSTVPVKLQCLYVVKIGS